MEIEAKMKVDDLAAVRRRLRKLKARPRGVVLETNIFFDTRKSKLRHSGRGLRLRVALPRTGAARCTVTMKGPLLRGKLKTREEIEFSVSELEPVGKMLGHLGYRQTLSFEKRRETWLFRQCKVELDELPYLGSFIEIEGESSRRILAVRKLLGLSRLPLIRQGYISMLAHYVNQHDIDQTRIRLSRGKR